MEKLEYLHQNVGAATLQLTDADLTMLNELPPPHGGRFAGDHASLSVTSDVKDM
jgi:hypothetical protein